MNCDVCIKRWICWIIQKWESEHKKAGNEERAKAKEYLSSICGSYIKKESL